MKDILVRVIALPDTPFGLGNVLVLEHLRYPDLSLDHCELVGGTGFTTNAVLRGFVGVVQKDHADAVVAELQAELVEGGPLFGTVLGNAREGASYCVNDQHVGAVGFDPLEQLFAPVGVAEVDLGAINEGCPDVVVAVGRTEGHSHGLETGTEG